MGGGLPMKSEQEVKGARYVSHCQAESAIHFFPPHGMDVLDQPILWHLNSGPSKSVPFCDSGTDRGRRI
jgi:hypothetical protein